MDQNHEHAFLYYRSPEDIRKQEFSHRMRGVDADEVYEFLDLLADQVSSTEVERTEHLRDNERLNRENDQLRFENERLRAELQAAQEQRTGSTHGETSAQAAALLAQAQEVADQLVEEAVQHARDLIASARHREPPRESTWGSSEAQPAPVRDDTQGETGGYGATPPAQPSGGFERTFTYRRRTGG